MPSECIFCKIVAKQIPSSAVYEDSSFYAFLDITPVNKGHTLVIPKKHYGTLLEMPRDIVEQFAVVCQKVGEMVKTGTKADGLNFLVNNDPAAGQEVLHAHQHIIPRFSQDGFRFGWPHQKYAEGEMADVAKKIAKHL